MFSTVLLFREALYGALVIALACSVLGVYVVLRRIVFVGAAIAQLSTAGIALALFLSGMGVIGSFAGHTTTFSLAFALAGAMFFAAFAMWRSAHASSRALSTTSFSAAATSTSNFAFCLSAG